MWTLLSRPENSRSSSAGADLDRDLALATGTPPDVSSLMRLPIDSRIDIAAFKMNAKPEPPGRGGRLMRGRFIRWRPGKVESGISHNLLSVRCRLRLIDSDKSCDSMAGDGNSTTISDCGFDSLR